MIAYFNCTSGISGDMLLGALVDAGMPIEGLKRELVKLPIDGYALRARKVKKCGIMATKVDVEIQGSKGKASKSRKWKDIEKIINTSGLSDGIKQKGLSVFKRLFEVEAKVHGEKMHDIHLHELGATDCLIDIMGTFIGFQLLGIESVYSSPLNLGSGAIKTDHGILPVPAPATAELLKGIPVYSSEVRSELTTPTGAVLVTSLAKKFGPMPDMRIVNTAYGAGGLELRDRPNVLMMVVGEKAEVRRAQNTDSAVTVIETNIDDMNPQVYGYVMEKLFEAGALDVFLTQMIMKKGRPGVMLSVLCDEENTRNLIDIILDETTSLGVRFYSANRVVLSREIKHVKTVYGIINVKVAVMGNKKKKRAVEYEDCRKIAKKFNIPLIEVMKAVK